MENPCGMPRPFQGPVVQARGIPAHADAALSGCRCPRNGAAAPQSTTAPETNLPPAGRAPGCACEYVGELGLRFVEARPAKPACGPDRAWREEHGNSSACGGLEDARSCR